MRWARSEPGARAARPGWPVVLLAALLGAGVGVTVPRPAQTAAVFVDDTTVTGTFEVRPCSNAWLAAVTSRVPTRHYDFASTSAIPGNMPSPGLLVCNPSGARRLNGDPGESVTDPNGAMPVAEATSLVVWVSITDSATPGDLVWLTQFEGTDIGLRVSEGQLELVEAPSGGDPVVLAAVAAPGGGPHMLTLTRLSPDSVQLWLDSSAVATAATSRAGAGALTLQLGARPSSSASSASAVLDEVVVLPAALDAANIVSLVSTNIW